MLVCVSSSQWFRTAMMRPSFITAKLLMLFGLMSLSIQSSSFSEVSLDEM